MSDSNHAVGFSSLEELSSLTDPLEETLGLFSFDVQEKRLKLIDRSANFIIRFFHFLAFQNLYAYLRTFLIKNELFSLKMRETIKAIGSNWISRNEVQKKK